MNYKPIITALLAASVLPASANANFTNSLTYNDVTNLSVNSQANFPAQPAFLLGSGLDVSFVWGGGDGAWEKIDFYPASTVPASNVAPGARFGTNTGGNGTTDGRNYLRTLSNNADYYLQNFDAFVTVRRANAAASVFFGMGSGALGSAKAPDRGTNNASAFLELESATATAATRVTANSIDSLITSTAISQTTSNALRMRMRYNATAATITYTLDYDYNGTFEEQQVLPSLSVATQVSEWVSGDRASIYFGGDRSVIFTDLVVQVSGAVPPPPPVSSLQVTAFGNQTVTLTWNPGFAGNTYSIYRSTTSGSYGASPVPIGTTNAATFTYTDTAGLINGTPYFYVVTQTNSTPAQSNFSNEVTATPTGAALAPTGLVARNAGTNAVFVDWATPVSPVNSFTVYRSSDGGTNFNPVVPGGTGLTNSEFLDDSVTNGTSYTYKVRAVLNDVESPDSATVTVTPQLLEVFVDFGGGAPSGRGVVGAGSGTSWNVVGDATSVATTKLNGSSGAVTNLGISGGSSFTFGAGAGVHVGGNPATLTQLGFDIMTDYRFSDVGIRNYTFSGLVPNRKYDLYAYGYGIGLGENSAFRTGGIAKQTTDPTGLTTPTESRHYVTFTVVSDETGSFTLDWSHPSNLGLTDAQTGNSSGFNGFQLVENASALLQPMGLISVESPNSVVVAWDDVEDATSYKVFRSSTLATGYIFQGSSTTTIYTDTSATPGIEYYYVVKAVNGTVESFSSREIKGVRTQVIFDADSDGLSDSDEALIGTDPNNPNDFFKATSSTVTPNAVSFVINGAQGTYVIERSSSLMPGSWTEVAGSQVTWTSSVLTNLELSATVTPALGGKEFFRAKGVVPTP